MGSVRLVTGLEVANQKITTQIAIGREIQHLQRRTANDVEEFQARFLTWDEYVASLLDGIFETRGAMQSSPRNEFALLDIDIFGIKLGVLKTAENVDTTIASALDKKLRILESIRDRLELWNDVQPPTELKASGEAIFLVHGHDHESREHVRSFLLRCASRDVIVLDEKPGEGADILGKLLTHAQKAAYAVVLLTGDDEGRAVGPSDLQRRARQNVILELGLFIGLLGRSKVIALYEPGVEIPSDYLGVTYIELDPNKAWRIDLVSEMRAAGIEASIDQTL